MFTGNSSSEVQVVWLSTKLENVTHPMRLSVSKKLMPLFEIVCYATLAMDQLFFYKSQRIEKNRGTKGFGYKTFLADHSFKLGHNIHM